MLNSFDDFLNLFSQIPVPQQYRNQEDPMAIVYSRMACELLLNKDIQRFAELVTQRRFTSECANYLFKTMVLKNQSSKKQFPEDKSDLLSTGLSVLLKYNKINFHLIYGEKRNSFFLFSQYDSDELNINENHFVQILDYLLDNKIFILALAKEMNTLLDFKGISKELKDKFKKYSQYAFNDKYTLDMIQGNHRLKFDKSYTEINIPAIFDDSEKLSYCHTLYILGLGFDPAIVIGEKDTSYTIDNCRYMQRMPYFETFPDIFNNPVAYFDECCQIMNEKWEMPFSPEELKMISVSFHSFHKSIYQYQ